jgi:hypothetical protein
MQLSSVKQHTKSHTQNFPTCITTDLDQHLPLYLGEHSAGAEAGALGPSPSRATERASVRAPPLPPLQAPRPDAPAAVCLQGRVRRGLGSRGRCPQTLPADDRPAVCRIYYTSSQIWPLQRLPDLGRCVGDDLPSVLLPRTTSTPSSSRLGKIRNGGCWREGR